MTEIAIQGEAMGFDYLTLTDHVVLPDTKVPGYPYSESGEFYEDAPTERHEQLVAMGYVAAKTTRIRLVAAVPPCWPPRCWPRSTCCPAGGWSWASAPAG